MIDTKKIKVLIADDHRIVRDGLKRILADTGDIIVTGEAHNGRATLEKLREADFDLVLLDISMPRTGGLDVLKQIRRDYPNIPVLVLTMHPEEQYATRVLKLGAAGYLTKESAAEDLEEAIRKVIDGRKHITSSLAEKLAHELYNDSDTELHKKLSNREYEVMIMIASGSKLKDIAEALSLNVKTISTYRTRILEKMKMKSNAEMTHYAMSKNLVQYFPYQ